MEGQPRHEYEIDGAQFSSWEELWALLDPILAQARLIPEGFSCGSLDGLNEALGGWFNEQQEDDDYWPPGKPASFVIRWKNSAISRDLLGTPLYTIPEKRRQLERYSSTDPARADSPWKRKAQRKLRKEIRQMKRGVKVDPTAFEVVISIFRDHAPGGVQMDNEVSGVTLLLE